MSTNHGSFATILGCMDGRTQEKATAYAKHMFGADHIDTINLPGMDGILVMADHPVLTPEEEQQALNLAQKMLSVSTGPHASTQILVYGHCGCAGYPVSFEEHQETVRKAVETVKGWAPEAEVIGAVFDDNWEIRPL